MCAYYRLSYRYIVCTINVNKANMSCSNILHPDGNYFSSIGRHQRYDCNDRVATVDEYLSDVRRSISVLVECEDKRAVLRTDR